jgi:hypothetical protein
MDVIAPLVVYLQHPKSVHPQQSSLHYPTVSYQLLTGPDATAGYPRDYAPLPQDLAAAGKS